MLPYRRIDHRLRSSIQGDIMGICDHSHHSKFLLVITRWHHVWREQLYWRRQKNLFADWILVWPVLAHHSFVNHNRIWSTLLIVLVQQSTLEQANSQRPEIMSRYRAILKMLDGVNAGGQWTV